eukprot:TRINITY_DN90_c0_g1_i1.p1 TRINITY_DN90_c0_g1~~TRINITY_DN90_c0_g1_i1.p1  ORF type:complete len:150 (+),score=25.20 TRINITY_DN90_c0_g1_i1:84-533(+)
MAQPVSARRLATELRNLDSKPLGWASAKPVNDDLYKWEVIMTGPEKTPFDNGKFKLELKMPPEFPFKPPEIKFVTKIYHPNVDKTGSLCPAALTWSPQTRIPELLLQVRQIMIEPNPDHPLDAEIALIFKENRSQFDKTAKEWTKQHAK